MEYNELIAAVEQLDDELAIIRRRGDPTQEFLAEIEYCDQWKGVGAVYFFFVDKRTLTVQGEGLSKLTAEAVISLRKSGIPIDKPSTAHVSMATFIVAHANGNLDFDALIASICQLYPGSEITEVDYYAARIARQIEIAEKRGMPIPNPPLDCMSRVSEEHGLQRQIAVPIHEGLCLTGRIDRFGCLFNGPEFTRAEVQPLLDLLAAAGLAVQFGVAGKDS